jgi:rhamnogalacturonan endolyase
MHDHTYRMGICWQNTAYNQPPHLGYYLPDAMLPRIINQEKVFTVAVNEEIDIMLSARYTSLINQSTYVLSDGTKKAGVPAGMEKKADFTKKTLSFSGAIAEAGDYRLIISLTGLNSEKATDTLTIHVIDSTVGITQSLADSQPHHAEQVYDLQGRKTQNAPIRGLFLMRRNGKMVKVIK